MFFLSIIIIYYYLLEKKNDKIWSLFSEKVYQNEGSLCLKQEKYFL